MPASSVAFVICNCKPAITSSTPVGTVTRIWSSETEDVTFAEESAGKIVTFFESFFDLKFPLPKIDFVVVPNLRQSALHGWGLVFFRLVFALLCLTVAQVETFFQGFFTTTCR